MKYSSQKEDLFIIRLVQIRINFPATQPKENRKPAHQLSLSHWQRQTDMLRNLDVLVGQEGSKTIDGNAIRDRAVVSALVWLADDGMPDGPRKRGTFEIRTLLFFTNRGRVPILPMPVILLCLKGV